VITLLLLEQKEGLPNIGTSAGRFSHSESTVLILGENWTETRF
jgi:hypothetical protein